MELSLAVNSSSLWDPYVWLIKGYDWQDFKSKENINYPDWGDLWTYPFVIAVVVIAVRFLILNQFVYGPVALRLGLKKPQSRPVIPNIHLEQLYYRFKNTIPYDELITTAEKIGWSERKVERWLRQRLAMTKVSKYTKFLECSWQFTYCSSIFTYGIYVMVDKPWLYDLSKCFYEYPNHNVETDVWWYYILSLSFYWSMIFTHFVETKRKDFWQMFFHHIITICLLTISWTINITRLGTLVLFLHDIADVPLFAAKMCIFFDFRALRDAFFVLFAVIWAVTRDCIYPLWIIKSTLFEANIFPFHGSYFIINSLLVTLFVLHIYWTYFIFKVASNSILRGVKRDSRSSSDELQDEDEKEIKANSDSPVEKNSEATEVNDFKNGGIRKLQRNKS